ncbi:DUF4097 family beta strand repeat-containing protein [Pseudidiomarina salilacus]|uniref:DUF4097 family beta strand repeat-containing protein n=1 Tax=Pseudidiomarina salilacus TaxID=3384452 RepID=UPI0039849806
MQTLNKVMLTAALSLVMLPAQAKQESVDQRLQVPSNVVVSVDNLRGDIDILGADIDYADVKGKLDEYATGFTFELNGSNLTIKVEMPERGNFSGDEETELTIRLPLSAMLEVNGVSTDFDVKNFSSDVRVNTVSGDIEADDLNGRIRLSTVSGDVDGERLAGEVDLKSVSGDVSDEESQATRVSYRSTSGDVTADTVARHVTAESVSGDVKLHLQEVDTLQIKSVSGDLEARTALAANGRIEANSVSGDAKLTLTGALNARIEAEVSGGGSIENRLNDARVDESEWGTGASLTTELGDGSARVELTSMSGDIVLQKN